MAKKDPRVDAYIAKAQPFAQPILKRIQYIEWVAGAKSDTTRDRRLETAVQRIAEGQSRNWKYE